MWLQGLGRRFHEAITRPSRPVDVDHDAHREVEARQRRIERKMERLRGLRARANLERLRREGHGA